MVGVNQSVQALSPTIKDVERNILATKYQHGGNPVLRWNFRNVLAKRYPNENIQLVKVGDNFRIDGIDALVDAEHRRTANWNSVGSVYDSRGVTVI
jgi:phage terminase large subunit-like protein